MDFFLFVSDFSNKLYRYLSSINSLYLWQIYMWTFLAAHQAIARLDKIIQTFQTFWQSLSDIWIQFYGEALFEIYLVW